MRTLALGLALASVAGVAVAARNKPGTARFQAGRRAGTPTDVLQSGQTLDLAQRGLVKAGRGTWRSKSGLLFREGPTLNRILSHASDDPHAQTHGVFAAGDRAIGAIDSAWHVMKNTPNWELESVDGPRRTVVVETGPRIGWIGGKQGAAAGRPVANHVRLVLEGDHVLDAEPVLFDRMPRVLAANVNVPVRARPQLAVRGRMSTLLQARGVERVVARDAAEHIELGMPTDAGRAHANDWLLADDGSVVSYNAGRMSPNWAAWVVNAEDTRSLPRPKGFKSNSTLPEGFLRMSERDIKGSGMTRGHLVAAGERGASVQDTKDTFLFTNILPQAVNSNGGPWNGLETHYRGLAKEGKSVHVFAGGIYGKTPRLIGRGLPVPDAMWKVAVVLEKGETVRNVGPNTRVIAQIVPNDDAKVGKNDDWGAYRTSVAEIERQTGYDFFSNLPKAVGDALKAKVDATPTGHAEKMRVREERRAQRAARSAQSSAQ